MHAAHAHSVFKRIESIIEIPFRLEWIESWLLRIKPGKEDREGRSSAYPA